MVKAVSSSQSCTLTPSCLCYQVGRTEKEQTKILCFVLWVFFKKVHVSSSSVVDRINCSPKILFLLSEPMTWPLFVDRRCFLVGLKYLLGYGGWWVNHYQQCEQQAQVLSGDVAAGPHCVSLIGSLRLPGCRPRATVSIDSSRRVPCVYIYISRCRQEEGARRTTLRDPGVLLFLKLPEKKKTAHKPDWVFRVFRTRYFANV